MFLAVAALLLVSGIFSQLQFVVLAPAATLAVWGSTYPLAGMKPR